MRTIPTFIASTALVLSLSACGDNKNDRALSGAGIGAATGAAAGALVAGNPAGGAVVGGAIGAATGAAVGALTEKKDLDLGKPAWK